MSQSPQLFFVERRTYTKGVPVTGFWLFLRAPYGTMIEVRWKKISNNKLATLEKVWSSFLSMNTCTFKSYSLLRCKTTVRSMSISQKSHFGSPTAIFRTFFFPPFLGVRVFIAPVLFGKLKGTTTWSITQKC